MGSPTESHHMDGSLLRKGRLLGRPEFHLEFLVTCLWLPLMDPPQNGDFAYPLRVDGFSTEQACCLAFFAEHDAQMAGSCGWFIDVYCWVFHISYERNCVLVQVKSSKHTIDSIRDDADWCSWDSFVAEYLSKCKAFGTTMLCYV